MWKFKLDTILAKIKTLTYTTDAWYKKSVYGLSGEEKKWYFVAQSEYASDQGRGKYGQVFKFECDYPFAVKEADRLVIEGEEYDVKATVRMTGRTIDRIRCILVKSNNE